MGLQTPNLDATHVGGLRDHLDVGMQALGADDDDRLLMLARFDLLAALAGFHLVWQAGGQDE